MKRILFSLFVLLLAFQAQSQVSFGVKFGGHSQLNQPGSITIPTPDEELKFSVDDLKLGFQFGGFLRIGDKLFLQPEVLFNTNRTDYRVSSLALGDLVKSESYQYLDFPLLGGFSVGPFMLHGGPVGHYFLSSSSELTDFDGYAQKFDQFTWGWLAGVGIGRGRVQLDLRYEGNFNNYGDHVQFFGDSYHFSNNPARLMLNMNVKLIGK
ncbi:MAG: outer membrane beta-barrel protein [Saprospiraceae bacterium]